MTKKDKIKEAQGQLNDLNALVTLETWNELTPVQVTYITQKQKELNSRIAYLEELPETPEVGDTIRVKTDGATGEVLIGVQYDMRMLVRMNETGAHVWVHESSVEIVKPAPAPVRSYGWPVWGIILAFAFAVLLLWAAIYFHTRYVNESEIIVEPLSDTVARIPDGSL